MGIGEEAALNAEHKFHKRVAEYPLLVFYVLCCYSLESSLSFVLNVFRSCYLNQLFCKF